MVQNKNDQEMEAFFTAEKADAPKPSAALMAAILHDGQSQQPEMRGILPARTGTKRQKWWSADAFGGWGGLSALSACLVLGVSVGYASPQSLSNLALTMLDSAGIEQTIQGIPLLDDVMAGG